MNQGVAGQQCPLHFYSTRARWRAALTERSFVEAAQETFQLHYDCGLTLQMRLHEAARERRSSDLWVIWRDFLSRVRTGTPWTDDAFLDAAERHTGEAAIDETRRWLEGRLGEPEGAGE